VSGAPHPWNDPLWQRLCAGAERLPHGLLFAGPEGLGKNALAMGFAQWLLCAAPGETRPCGTCQNCTLFVAGTHPDLHVMQPERLMLENDDAMAVYARRYPVEGSKDRKKKSQEIRIDQIRALLTSLQTHAHISRRKLALFSPAHAMNVNAANSLLKLLEEPPADTVLILVSSEPSRLPATVRSRCSRLDFAIPPREAALEWFTTAVPGADHELLLDLAGGAPLKAAQWAAGDFLAQRSGLLGDTWALAAGRGDPVSCANRWQKSGVEMALVWLQGWIADLIRLASGGQPGVLFNPDALKELHAAAKRLHLKDLYAFSEKISEARRVLGGGLDEGLVIEDILTAWFVMNRRTAG
jgi:DNA polymerase-3 subunit delta'